MGSVFDMVRLNTMSSIPSRSVTLVLIVLIMSVYILQQNGTIVEKLMAQKNWNMNKIMDLQIDSQLVHGRHILNKQLSKTEFLKKTKDLRRKIDAIASMKPGKLVVNENLRDIPNKVSQTNNLVHNRIDKAGSTTLIRTLDIMAYNKSFHLIGQGTPNVRFFSKVQEEKLAEML